MNGRTSDWAAANLLWIPWLNHWFLQGFSKVPPVDSWWVTWHRAAGGRDHTVSGRPGMLVFLCFSMLFGDFREIIWNHMKSYELVGTALRAKNNFSIVLTLFQKAAERLLARARNEAYTTVSPSTYALMFAGGSQMLMYTPVRSTPPLSSAIRR